MYRTCLLITLLAATSAVWVGCQQDNKPLSQRRHKVPYYTLRLTDETFEDVSLHVYQTRDYAQVIAENNPDVKESDFQPGLRLAIPEVRDLAPINCSWESMYY